MARQRLALTAAALAVLLPGYAAWQAMVPASKISGTTSAAHGAEPRKGVSAGIETSGNLSTGRAETTSGTKPADKPAAEKKAETKKAEESSKFLRVVRNKKGVPTSLETSIVRYVPATGDEKYIIDLVGAVHIGDKSYYRNLNKKMEDYDVLLYELVAPKGTRVPRSGTRGGSNAPGLVKSMLDLESQVDRIDYTRQNFVHADLSPQDMAAKMKERGEDGWSVTFSILGDMIRQGNIQAARRAKSCKPAPEVNLLSLLFSDNSSLKLKRVMAEELEHAGDPQALGNTLNVMLIKDRNEAAMKVLKTELGKGRKKIGIFYGAAHMPDFEKRLIADHKVKVKSVEWLTAWDLDE